MTANAQKTAHNTFHLLTKIILRVTKKTEEKFGVQLSPDVSK